jgi:hypothetical protein
VRRAGVSAAAIVVALAGVVGLIAFFQSRDSGSLDTDSRDAPGVRAPDLTDRELAAGNVRLTYRESAQRQPLRDLAERIAGPADAALLEAGQSVLVQARPSGGGGVVAEAWQRRLETADPADPALRAFIEYWLGRGSGGS